MDRPFPMPPGSEAHDAIAMLLATARLRISQGNPSSALQAVIAALKASGGDGAVLQTLAKAREIYQSRMRANADANELATLFAECAIGEADASVPNSSSAQPMVDDAVAMSFVPCSLSSWEQGDVLLKSSSSVEAPPPILAESGRMQVVMDASADGSSFICLQCGGLVSKLRRDEHMAYWCARSHP